MRLRGAALVLAAICLSLVARAQQVIPSGGSGVPITTVADLGTPAKGSLAVVTNGATGTDCTTGGGSFIVTCQYSGSAWAALSSSGTMIYPAAGIAVSSGTAWGTSLAAPGSAIVGISDTQSLTNKTLDGVTPATMAFVDPTSSIQTQLTGKQPTLTSYSTIVGLFGGGSCSGFLFSDGTCSTPAGGGNLNMAASPTPLAGGIPVITDATHVHQSANCTPPTADGVYWMVYVVTASAAVDPSCPVVTGGVNTVSTNTTLTASNGNQLIDVTGAATITLPATIPSSPNNSFAVAVKRDTSGAVSIAPNGVTFKVCSTSSTSSFSIPVQGESLTIGTDGTNYVSKDCPLAPGTNVTIGPPGSGGLPVSTTGGGASVWPTGAPASDVVFSPAPGTYSSTQTVSATCPTGATGYVSLTPFTVSNSTVSVSATGTVEGSCVGGGYQNLFNSASYTISSGLAVASIIAPATGSFGSPYSLPVTSAVAAGSDVNVLIGGGLSAADAVTVTDSHGNCSGYAQKLSQIDSSSGTGVLIYNCKITTALTTSDHFTITPATDGHWGFMAEAVTGITTGFDNAAGNTQALSNTTQTSATYTPGNANEVVTACFATVTDGWSAYGNIISSAATGLATPPATFDSRYFMCEYRIISSVTAGTGTVTVTAATFGTSGIFGDY